MAIISRISEQEYEQIALAEPDQKWELYEGQLRGKPGMGWEHSKILLMLGYLILLQIDQTRFCVLGESHVRRSPGNIYIPNLVVVPASYEKQFIGRPGRLAILSDPLPLVVEIWSASTGGYDVNAKIPEYQRRGDLEIWHIHPFERTVTTWRRQADGSYDETVYRSGHIEPVALPGVAIDLAKLFSY